MRRWCERNGFLVHGVVFWRVIKCRERKLNPFHESLPRRQGERDSDRTPVWMEAEGNRSYRLRALASCRWNRYGVRAKTTNRVGSEVGLQSCARAHLHLRVEPDTMVYWTTECSAREETSMKERSRFCQIVRSDATGTVAHVVAKITV